MTNEKTRRYSPEVKQRAMRMVVELAVEYSSRWAAVDTIAGKIGCNPATLHEWEIDQIARAEVPTEVGGKMKAMEREIRELRQGNEILRRGLSVFRDNEARPPVEAMIGFRSIN